MALRDKDFIEKQAETAAKGLSKFLDMAELDALFKKKEDEQGQTEDTSEDEE